MYSDERTEPASWRVTDPSDARRWLSHVNCSWWIAGGWAIDLFLGRQTRAHADLDIGILRRDVHRFMTALSSWDFHEVKGGVLTPLQMESSPREDVNCLWARPTGEVAWSVEVLLDRSDDDDWVFRRHPGIRRPLASVVRKTTDGTPYLAPEIQLLYKAKAIRPRDELDFRRAMPRLTPTAMSWLKEALVTLDAAHPWLRR